MTLDDKERAILAEMTLYPQGSSQWCILRGIAAGIEWCKNDNPNVTLHWMKELVNIHAKRH